MQSCVFVGRKNLCIRKYHARNLWIQGGWLLFRQLRMAIEAIRIFWKFSLTSQSRFDRQCLELDRSGKKQHCGAKASSFVLHAVGCEHLSGVCSRFVVRRRWEWTTLENRKLTLPYSTLYSTLLYSALLYSIPLYSTLLCFTLLYTLFYFTVLFSSLLYSTLFYCTLLVSTLLYFTLLYFILLYFTLR